MKLWYKALTGLAVAASAAVLAPAAFASSVPSLTTLTPSTTQAASTSDNLALDLTFANDSSDSPENLTINLPPGLLANTALTDASTGQSCLSETTNTNAGCELGTGVVTTDVPVLLDASLPVDVSFYLVAPPAAGDLGGLYVYSSTLGTSLGTGDISIRPSGSTDGVGATIKLTLPQQIPASALGGLGGLLGLVNIQVSEIQSTFDNLRNPATCGPATVGVSTTSYAGDAESTSGSFTPTGCASLPYNPQFSATATRDAGDEGVAVTTDITQAAAEAPNASVSLAFPTSMFGPNLNAIKSLCITASVRSCSPVGSVSAASPLYPTALSGQAYLTGNSSGLGLKLVFPSPFPLTLNGVVSLTTNTASFTGLPDIPLTDLKVTLTGGANSLFVATCQASTGAATASLGAQDGATTSRSATITYSGCPADNPPVGKTGSGSGPSTGSGTSSSGGATAPTVTSTTLASIGSPSARGLASGKPTLTFKLAAGKKAAKLTRVTVKLPSGLSFRSHKKNGKKAVKGVTLSGAKAKSATLSGSKLVVVFKTGTRKVTVQLGSKALKETKALKAKAKAKQIKSLTLKVTTRNAKGKSKALTAKVTRLNLGG